MLQQLYSKLYSIPCTGIEVPSVCWKYRSVNVSGTQLGSHKSRCASSSTVFASWSCDVLGRPASSIVENLVVSDSILRAARIITTSTNY